MIRQLFHFFWASALAVVVDLSVFALLVWAGLPAWASNMISSGIAVTITYLLVSRFAFGMNSRVTTYLLFFAWYVVSISIFSVLVETAHSQWRWPEIVAKLVSLPFSFAVNFLFSRALFAWIARRGVARDDQDRVL